MPLIPEYARLLKDLADLRATSISELPIDIAREEFRKLHPLRMDLPVGSVKDLKIPLADGCIAARLYTPARSGPHPAILYFHGGGWVLGDLDTADGPCRELCRGAGASVISVEYRLAPLHRFPTAFEDAYAGLVWIVSNSESLCLDPTRVAIAGESAGGNLAAACALAARERQGPDIALQFLAYPVTDGTCFDRDSFHRNREGYLLSSDLMKWFWNEYLPVRDDRAHPYASPLSAPDLSGLPPALIMTAEFDPLRDEGIAYGDRLRQSGVPVDSVDYEGFIHGFLSHTGRISAAREAMDYAARVLAATFASDD